MFQAMALALALAVLPDASALGDHTWRPSRQYADSWYLVIDGTIHGLWDCGRQSWYTLRGGAIVAEASAPPWEKKVPSPVEKPLFGVDEAKLGKPGYKINGRAVSREQAKAAVEGKQLDDDSKKLRLTVIGPESDRKRVLGDLASQAELAVFKEALLVQAYPPDHWAVRDAGFITTGRPTIYLQEPTGKVLHRQDDYTGPGPLAEAIRRADPAYKSATDRDLRSWLPSVPGLAEVPSGAWVLAAGLLALLGNELFRRKARTA